MNILMIYEGNYQQGGGIQVHVNTLRESLLKNGHNVLSYPVSSIISTTHKGKNRALAIVLSPIYFVSDVINILIFLNKKNFNFHIIHVHAPRKPLLLGMLLKFMTSRPLIITQHEAYSVSLKLIQLWKKADFNIAISKEIINVLYLYGLDKGKAIYIPNMVKEAEIEPSYNSYEKNILFMGRLHPSKVDILKELLSATPDIIKKHPETRILIAGPQSSSQDEVNRIAHEINTKYGRKIIEILGYVPNTATTISKAMIVVGVGRVALESMIQGKPTIVGSSSNGEIVTGDLVQEGNIETLETYNFTGRYYNKKIDKTRMAKIILKLLNNNHYRNMVGEFCRSYINQNFVDKEVTNKIITLYLDLIRTYNH